MAKYNIPNQKTPKRKIIRNVIEFITNLSKKHWLIYTIILTIPPLWFSVLLPYWGTDLQLINQNSELTTLGKWVTIIIMVSIGSGTLINNWCLSKTEKSNIDNLVGNLQYLSAINNNVDKICNEKLSGLKNRIVAEKNGQKEKALIISNPTNQLKRIMDGITECMVALLNTDDNNYKFKDVTVTIIYRFPLEREKWEWAEGGGEKDMSIDELLEPDCQSTFNYLIQTRKKYYFNNKKENAKAEKRYVYTPQDKLCLDSKGAAGSIFCYRYDIKQNDITYVEAIISITTQRKRFCNNDDIERCNNTCDNIVSLVGDHFGKRISIELSLLYLEYLKNLEMSALIINHNEAVALRN